MEEWFCDRKEIACSLKAGEVMGTGGLSILL